jgi:hypothetical protein
MPRFNYITINPKWNMEINTNYVKDDFERFWNQIILTNRYIPDQNHTGSLFIDRYVQIKIKELKDNNNFATNNLTDNSFVVFPDKP